MITKLIIKNYTPLAKKGATYIELSTKDMFNIILGRNGFGKTSLLREFTPFPPDNADYMQGGYKEVHIVIDKEAYQLISTTGKSSKHNFIHNGKELNEGNTLLVQRELVKIHFGITQNVKNIITGLDARDLFTTLSSPRRKDFLMSINPNDTSFALKVFDKLKSNHNSLKGGLKQQRQRLVVEEGRLKQLASMDPEELQIEIRQLDDQIKNALIIHGQLSSVEYNDINSLKHQIGSITSSLIGNNSRVKHSKSTLLKSKESLYGTLDYHRVKETRLSTMLAELTSQLSGIDMSNSNLDSYRQMLDTNIKMTDMHYNELTALRSKYSSHEIFYENELFNDRGFSRIADEVISYLHGVEKAVDTTITSGRYAERKNQYTEISNELDTVTRKLNEIRHTLNHFQRADSVECPKCANKFKIGFEKLNPAELNAQAVQLEERKIELTKTCNDVKDWLQSNEGWFDSMSSMMKFAKRTDYTQILIRLIQEYNVGKGDISVLIDLVRNTTVYADVSKTLETLDKEKTNIETQIKFLESSDVETLFKRSEYVERELSSTQSAITRSLRAIQDIDQQLDIIEVDVQQRDRLRILMSELKENVEENGMYRVKVRVEEIIQELGPRKDQLSGNLIRAQSLNAVIESIKENIADMERREKHTQLLLDSLSPVKGLIGYLMNDFLKSVVANVNAIIQPIWTNRLHVMSCSTSSDDEDVDLSYSFPVLSGDSDKPNKDVGDCSGGEREIINFAFRLVLLRYLGKRCSLPLMMDEVGVAFDELHRGRFCAYIAEQLRLDKLPQTVMISHYINQFGVFNSANVIALNTEGLSIPVKVNTNAIIK